MTNGFLNTERNAHALQTAFGMIGLRELLPRKIKIDGLVIVCAADGTKCYTVDNQFVDEKKFTIPSIQPALGQYVRNVSFQPLPSNDVAQKVIERFLKKKSISFNVQKSMKNKYGSFCLLDTKNGNKCYTVIALVYSQQSRCGNKKRSQLEDDAAKLWMDKKRKVKVTSCILYFGSQKTTDGIIQKLEPLPKIHYPE